MYDNLYENETVELKITPELKKKYSGKSAVNSGNKVSVAENLVIEELIVDDVVQYLKEMAEY